jgi:NAD(P)-dependent dehydrogenase (short-subunit alcohol dehydrogenase family)
MLLDNRVAVLVGGGQTPGETIGNGRATAIELAREGAKVWVADPARRVCARNGGDDRRRGRSGARAASSMWAMNRRLRG